MRPYRPVIIVPLLVLFSAAAWAETISLPLTDDVRINANKPTSNFGSYDMLVHDYGPKYSLVRFDAASISGQSISSAVLELYLSSIRQDGTISLHAITSSWSEATVTWDTQPPAEAAVAAVANLSTGDVGGTVAIDVTATVQRWADGSLADAGFLIVTNDDIKAYFDVKEMPAGTPATLTVDTGPAVSDGRAIVLDFTDPENCTIDEPGYYILDRSWDLSPPNPQGACVDGLRVEIDDVTINMKGYKLDRQRPEAANKGDATIHIGTYRVTLRDGTVAGNSAVYGEINSDLRTSNMWFDGGVWVGVGTIRSTEFYSPEDHGRPALRFEGRSDSPLPRFISVRNSVLSCANAETLCLEWMRASAEIVSNRLIGRGGIRGSGLIKGNVMTLDLSETRVAIESSGNTQIVHNIILNQSGVGKGIIFTGGPNDPTPEYPGAAIDGNIIIGVAIGIGFQDGINNHFGNNRVSATRPFSNTDGQIDWGGNVSF